MEEETINANETPSLSGESDLESTPELYFFTTSTFKLAVMSLCTFGIYELFWFYMNWVLIKERTRQDMRPFWRAFFAPLWAYSCFSHIKNFADDNNMHESLPAAQLAIGYFIVHALWKLPDPYWFVTFFSFVLLIPANSAAENVNRSLISDFKNNDTFSVWNWVGIILGGLLFLLSLIGTFMPEV